MRYVWVCLLMVVWSCHSTARAAEYYVDTDSRGGAAADGNPGTKDSPWKTLARAAGDKTPCPQPGDTVFIRGGTYKEAFNLTHGGTADKPLTIKAFPGEEPVIDGEKKMTSGVTLTEAGKADYVVIDGLKVTGIKGNAFDIEHRKGVVVQNVEARDSTMGVYFQVCVECNLLHSNLHHCEFPVYVDAPSSDIMIADNKVHHAPEYNGISLFGPADRVSAQGKVISVEPAGLGLARFTVEGVALDKVTPYGANILGQDAAASVKVPDLILLFTSKGSPEPDGKEIPGGTFPLKDGRKWFVLRDNPDWGGKPYSPDGKQALIETGQAAMADLSKATYFFLGHAFDPESRTNRDIQILRNEIYDNGEQGILAPSTDGCLIQGNTLHGNGATGIQIETGSRHIWLDGNVSYANNVVSGGETGMWTDEDIDVVIQNNTLYENQRGLSVTQCHWTLVRRNVIYNNKAQHVPSKSVEGCRYNSGGIQLGGGHSGHLGAPRGEDNCAFVHNTLYDNGAATSFWGGIEHGSGGGPVIGPNVILNNLIQDAHGAAVTYIFLTLPAALDGNIYQSSGPVKVQYVAPASAQSWTCDISEAAKFVAYQKATGLDAHSLVAPAAFADANACDFHLAKGSVAIDIGQPLAKTVGAGEAEAVPVTDVRCFSAGFKTSKGKLLIPGDEIMVAGAKARVLAIDREKKILTLDGKLTWKDGDSVTYVYSGAGPDVGAFEME